MISRRVANLFAVLHVFIGKFFGGAIARACCLQMVSPARIAARTWFIALTDQPQSVARL